MTGYYVQYLHSSAVQTSVGKIVAPWTIIGKTGNIPANQTTGIHLHLSVVSESGVAAHPCWSRNFVDPTRFNTGNPVAGVWTRSGSSTDENGIIQTFQISLQIASDEIGSSVTMQMQVQFTAGADYILVDFSYAGTIVSYNSNEFNLSATLVECDSSGTIAVDCHKMATSPVIASATLISMNSLQTTNSAGPAIWTRSAASPVAAKYGSLPGRQREQLISSEISFDPLGPIEMGRADEEMSAALFDVKRLPLINDDGHVI